MDLRGPVCRYSRAFGRKVDNKPMDKDPLSRRGSYPPGPRRRRKRPSDYAKHLKEVQVCRFVYGVYERKFRSYFKEAKREQGVTGNNLVQLLERRLDNVVFRTDIAETRRQARQMVVHRHIQVKRGGEDAEFRTVDRPSYRVKPGDEFRVKPSKKGNGLFSERKDLLTELQENFWLSLDPEQMVGEVNREPKPEEGEDIFDRAMIVEYYSKYV